MNEFVEKQRKSNIWKRDDLDWYVEPVRATEQLLRFERFVGDIWDPCCGQGNIIQALVNSGYPFCCGTDIETREPMQQALKNMRWLGRFDYKNINSPADIPIRASQCRNIISNPPFFKAAGTEDFILRALEFAHGKVIIFTDIRFLAGGSRACGIYRKFPPNRIYLITPRVSCPPGKFLADGGRASGGSSDWCWMVWDKTVPIQFTSVHWLTKDD